jgi:hypothetical protein
MEFSWRDRMVAWKAIVQKFEGIATAAGGGGFIIQRPERGDVCGEYERPDEPWWTCEI